MQFAAYLVALGLSTLLSGCAADTKPGAALPVVVTSTADIFDAVEAMPAAARSQYFAALGQLSPGDFYEYLHATTTSSPVIVNGALVADPLLQLEAKHTAFLNAGSAFPTVASVWDHLKMNPASMTRSQFEALVTDYSGGPSLAAVYYRPRDPRRPECDDVNSSLFTLYLYSSMESARNFSRAVNSGRDTLYAPSRTLMRTNSFGQQQPRAGAVATQGGDLIYFDADGQIKTFSHYAYWCLEDLNVQNQRAAQPPPEITYRSSSGSCAAYPAAACPSLYQSAYGSSYSGSSASDSSSSGSYGH